VIKTKNQKNIYLDYAASASPNSSSIHIEGVKAKRELENARSEIANILRGRPEEIIFTSGGTESNNIAIQGAVLAWHEKMVGEGPALAKLPHIITTNIEHPSVLETFKILQKRKLAEISIVPVEKNGIVDSKKIKKEIKKNTILVSVMYANNEIGTIQPIREIAKEIRHFRKNRQKSFFNGLAGVGDPGNRGPEKKISDDFFDIFPIFHTDAVQAVNYLDLNIEKLGVDLLSISGSKIENAGRVGLLYKRKSVPLTAIFGGGDQEFGLRPSTENLPAILKFTKAFKLLQKNKEKEVKRITMLRDYFIKKLKNQGDSLPSREGISLIFNGDLENRLPNNINITFPKIPSDLLVLELSEKGIMVSSKSACKSREKGGSYVIKAIYPESDTEIGGVRFSLGKKTSKADIDYTIKVLAKILIKLNKWYK
jgi:cysteine desulfurase